jgi:geranylgeranyl diphosphate synthase type II
MRASSELATGVAVAERFFKEARARVDARLEELLPSDTTPPEALHGAIRWSMFAGGKRFRPALLLAAGETFGAPETELLDTACALEMIHTYSLIHDDLPAMDDDDLRRGRPTCHVRFGEAIAILAGDALQTLAFQTIAEVEKLSPAVRVRLVSEIARASATPEGMVAGQAYDLLAESTVASPQELERTHRFKTGALIQASARAGAIIAGAEVRELNALTQYAAQLGLLFQITDDLLDVTATAEDLGKTPGKDERAQKVTYPALYGLEAARERALVAYKESCRALEEIASPTELLNSIALFILERRA